MKPKWYKMRALIHMARYAKMGIIISPDYKFLFTFKKLKTK